MAFYVINNSMMGMRMRGGAAPLKMPENRVLMC